MSRWTWEELQAYEDFMESWANAHLLEQEKDEDGADKTPEMYINEPF